MKLEIIIKKLDLDVINLANSNAEVVDAYASDLLSDVMGRAKSGQIWITMQTHRNVSAICSLKDLPAVIITGGGNPDEDMLNHAKDEGVCVLTTKDSCFNICGKLYHILNCEF